MTGFDDDEGVRRPLTDREADALLRGPELSGLVADLSSMATQAPRPSPALAALLAAGIVPEVTATAAATAAHPRRGRRRWLVALPLTGLVLGGTLGAASANVLPDGAQRVVSDTVSSLTPIRLPKPGKPRPAPEPTPAPAGTAAPSEDPGPSPHPTARPTRSPGNDDDGQDQSTSPRPLHASAPADEDHGPTSAPAGDEDRRDDSGKGDGDDRGGSRQHRQATR